MKKHFTLLFLLATMVALRSQAQLVPNGGLEVWNNIILYEDPDQWSSPNQLTSILGITPVTKSADSYDGQYAARLQSYFITQFNLTVPGAIGTGQIDATTQSFKGGFPLNGNSPAAVIGYYKYAPVNSDSCLVYSILFHWNTTTSKRDTVAITAFISGAQENYTQFVAPYFTLIPETPDSAIVIIATAKDILTAQEGSVMYVDDVDLTDALGVSESSLQSLSLYPNPADASMELNLPAELNAQKMIITNTAGTAVKQLNVTSGSNRIETKSFAQGLYICFVKNAEGKVVATGKFSVKH